MRPSGAVEEVKPQRHTHFTLSSFHPLNKLSFFQNPFFLSFLSCSFLCFPSLNCSVTVLNFRLGWKYGLLCPLPPALFLVSFHYQLLSVFVCSLCSSYPFFLPLACILPPSVYLSTSLLGGSISNWPSVPTVPGGKGRSGSGLIAESLMRLAWWQFHFILLKSIIHR